MFILGKDGRIVGRAPGTDCKPAPFVSDTAKWDGEKWTYNDDIEKFPTVDKQDCLTAYDIHCHIVDLLSPEPGSYTKPKDDKVSILIPAYGKKQYIESTIKSCLWQTVKPYEVVILDMDDEAHCDDELVRIVKHERLNASAARNLLVKLCKTEQFIFLDADDMLQEDYIEKVLKEEENIVGTSVAHMEQDGTLNLDGQFVGWEERPFTMINYNLTGLLCKEAFNDVGGLDESLAEGGEDSDFGVRLFEQKKWKVKFSAKTRLWYRINVGGLSTKKAFLKSKEVELHKHVKQFMEWLDGKDEPREQAREWVLKWRQPAKRVLEGFEAMWPYRTDDVMLIPVSLKDPKQFAVCSSLLSWSKLAEPLLLESRHRPTENICRLDSPRYNGRAVDVIVNTCPMPYVDKDKVLFNAGVDLDMPTIDMMKKYNVVWTESPVQLLDGFKFRECDEDRMFDGREAALF